MGPVIGEAGVDPVGNGLDEGALLAETNHALGLMVPCSTARHGRDADWGCGQASALTRRRRKTAIRDPHVTMKRKKTHFAYKAHQAVDEHRAESLDV